MNVKDQIIVQFSVVKDLRIRTATSKLRHLTYPFVRSLLVTVLKMMFPIQGDVIISEGEANVIKTPLMTI